MVKFISILKSLGYSLGPGLTYAAAAVGVSHLIQSTRAGAYYGLEFIFAIVLIHIIKYPFFLFASNYSSHTGETLLEGYNKIGKWAVGLFLVITFLTMFIIQAAVTLVTANVTKVVFFNSDTFSFLSVEAIQCLLLLICFTLVLWGRYRILDKFVKVIIIILTFSTLIAVVFSINKTSYFSGGHFGTLDFKWDPIHIGFLIAFLGWMPAPMDISVWYSEWNVAKQKETQDNKVNDLKVFDAKKSYFDFNVGYIGTAFLAILFLALGAFSLHGTGETFSQKSTVFVSQLIHLYTENVGSTLGVVVKIAAFTTMFSTTLACLDAFIRVLQRSTTLIIPHLDNVENKSLKEKSFIEARWISNLPYLKIFWSIVLLGGTLSILFYFKQNLLALIQFATIISFISSPVIAILSYLVVVSPKTSPKVKPKPWLKVLSVIGILYFVCFSVYYVTVVL